MSENKEKAKPSMFGVSPDLPDFEREDETEVEEVQEEQGKEVDWNDINEKLKDKGSKNFLKLEEGKVYEIKFLKDKPVMRTFTSPEGKEVESYEFEILYEGQKRVLSVTSKRLLKDLKMIREMNGKTLEGAKIKILKEGTGFGTTYSVIAGGK